MKTINLFVDFEFTSLSPDAQPISVGIVSEEYFNEQYRQLYTDKVEIKKGNCSIDHLTTKSFYAEFSDFDINRCDEWVRENVVGKLIYNEAKNTFDKFQYDAVTGNVSMKDSTSEIKGCLKAWLEQFSDYQITFVVDCGTWDWYHLLQLIGEWETSREYVINMAEHRNLPDTAKHEVELKAILKAGGRQLMNYSSNPNINVEMVDGEIRANASFVSNIAIINRIGLHILPANISPVPFELNQFIADKKGISVREAFELNREELAFGFFGNVQRMVLNEWHEQDMAFFGFPGEKSKNDKHNALWDAKVMKEIYEKLK